MVKHPPSPLKTGRQRRYTVPMKNHGKSGLPASLCDHIHAILHGTDEEKEKLAMRPFFVAHTPQFMKNLGLTGDYFAARYGVISHHKGKDADHGLSADDWRRLCAKITDPFAITKHGDGFNLFINAKINGKWIMAGILVKNAGKDIRVNAIRTVFGVRSAKGGGVIYRSKKITPDQTAFLDGTNSVNSRPQGLSKVSH